MDFEHSELAKQVMTQVQRFVDERVVPNQQTYLDQLRECKEEIHQLKVVLRQEQSRNQRLQQMLRREI